MESARLKTLPNPLPIPRVGIPTLNLYFTPLPDITAYELALCTTILLALAGHQAPLVGICAAWERLADTARRHWQP